MEKKILIISLVGILILGIYFFFPKKKEIVFKSQSKNCFCSPTNNPAMIACFDPIDKDYAVWQSTFNLALTPLKLPFFTGKWSKEKDKIKILFTNGREVEIKYTPQIDKGYPEGIKIENLTLRPDFCQNLDWAGISKILENEKEFAYFCSENDFLKFNFQLDFKEKTFKTWNSADLITRESIFLESPFKNGKFKIEGEQITFNFSDGMVRQGKMAGARNAFNFPEVIEFEADKTVLSASRDQCKWLEKSIRQIPLLNSQNILCEKSKNDDLVRLLENQTMNLYLNTTEFSLRDFVEDKATFQSVKYELKSNKISLSIRGKVRTGTFIKEGDNIVSLKFPTDKKGKSLDYSKEYCRPFYLTKKFPN